MPEGPDGSGVRRRSVLAALALAAPVAAAAGCSEAGPAAPEPGPPPGRDALVMVIRPAERPYAGATGQDADGEEDPGSLAARGWRRAEALPRLFPPSPHAPLPRPGAVFAVADEGRRAGAHRARQTVGPLAAALELTVRADLGPGQESRLAAAALAAGAPVLICWEHTGVPALVRGLGADGVLGVPAGWPDRYDLVWVFSRRAGRWSFRELPQHLLPGDA
ncbi:hypothetical protein [Streptomyces sp. NPDC093225]|uniref:hypothetical protein n=1 Tax=Streptomyces sp. NPDC093225 TaxID=3366034 RepID=UPI003804ED55